MKTLYTIIIITISFTLVLGQQSDINLAGISYTFNPAVGLNNPQNSQFGDAKMDLSEIRAFFLMPIQLRNDKTTLLGGIDYQFLGGPLDNLPGDNRVDANLHSLRFTAGMRQQIGEKWAIRALLMPTFASDFSGELKSDAFTLQSSILLQHIKNEDVRYGLGTAYTNGFGEPMLVPLAEFFYRKNNFDLLILAPVQAALRYRINDMFVGFRVDLQGNEYQLSADDNRQNIPNIESVKFSRYNLGPTIAWNMSGGTRIQLSGGFSVKRRLEAINEEGTVEDYDLKNGFFMKASLVFGNFK